MSDKDFNPRSTDAMFATILLRMDQQDAVLKEIRSAQKSDRADIDELKGVYETSKSRLAGAVAVISFIVGIAGWGISQGFHKLFDRG